MEQVLRVWELRSKFLESRKLVRQITGYIAQQKGAFRSSKLPELLFAVILSKNAVTRAF